LINHKATKNTKAHKEFQTLRVLRGFVVKKGEKKQDFMLFFPIEKRCFRLILPLPLPVAIAYEQ